MKKKSIIAYRVGHGGGYWLPTGLHCTDGNGHYRYTGDRLALWHLPAADARASSQCTYTLGYAMSFIANFYLTSYFTFGTAPSWKKLVGMG